MIKKVLLTLLFTLGLVSPGAAASVCDSQPTTRVDGIAIITVYRRLPGGGITYEADYQTNPYLTRRDGLVLSALPRGYNDDTYYKTLYHVDCVTGEDTVFVIGNMEDQDDITAYIECLRDGRQVFTQGRTFRAGTVATFSMAACLAQSP